MSARRNNMVPESKLRPIYDALDSRDYRAAIRLCRKGGLDK